MEWKGIRRRSIRRGMRRNLVARNSKIKGWLRSAVQQTPGKGWRGKEGEVKRWRTRPVGRSWVGRSIGWSLLLFSEAQWPAIWRFLDRAVVAAAAATLGLTAPWPLCIGWLTHPTIATTYNLTKWKE